MTQSQSEQQKLSDDRSSAVTCEWHEWRSDQQQTAHSLTLVVHMAGMALQEAYPSPAAMSLCISHSSSEHDKETDLAFRRLFLAFALAYIFKR